MLLHFWIRRRRTSTAMLLAEPGCVLMAFILYVSGVQGHSKSICALKGSSVDLRCSAAYPTSSKKWYNVHWDGYKHVPSELSPDGNRVTCNTSEESHPTLTINDLRESDANVYCCSENAHNPTECRSSGIELHVADLQVKVIPTTEGQTVTLMCSTSCPLTENPAAYIWYKNRELLYEDWSPWYQQLVSSEEAVRYSCAIKGYEDLRAPEVSVDSVTPTCFSVTYAKGRMCSFKETSEDEPCSITYPREVHVRGTPTSPIVLTCTTSCPLIDSQTAYRWYHGGYLYRYIERQQFTIDRSSEKRFSCAIKGHKDLLSAEVCLDNKNCWSVNYVSRRVCALGGSSVNISSEYLHPDNQRLKYKFWYKMKRGGEGDAEKLTEAAGHVEYHDNMKNHHILRIKNVKKNDSAEYIFRLEQDDKGWKPTYLPGVIVTVTDLKVKFDPSAVVTEGQRVTLSCSTSCPLTDNTNYIWYLNSRPLTLPENQNKHLVLDPVSSQHAGRYSCAVKTHNNISSREKTLAVHSKTGKWTSAAAVGVCAALLVIIPLPVFLWIRRKRTSSRSPRTETSDNTEQLNPGPVGDDISAQPAEQDDLHYSRVHFTKNQTDPFCSNVQPRRPQQQEDVHYAVVNFRQNRTP